MLDSFLLMKEGSQPEIKIIVISPFNFIKTFTNEAFLSGFSALTHAHNSCLRHFDVSDNTVNISLSISAGFTNEL